MRKLDKIRSVYDYLTAEEVYEGLAVYDQDEVRVCLLGRASISLGSRVV